MNEKIDKLKLEIQTKLNDKYKSMDYYIDIDEFEQTILNKEMIWFATGHGPFAEYLVETIRRRQNV